MFQYKKFVILLLVITLLTNHIFAQKNKLPPFQITTINKNILHARDLPFNKSVLIIYFLPDCKHCQDLTSLIKANDKLFSKTSIVWISYYPLGLLYDFSKKFKLLNERNYYIGTEGQYLFLKSYYHLNRLPFIALYSKQGDLIKTYQSESDFYKLITQIKKLK